MNQNNYQVSTKQQIDSMQQRGYDNIEKTPDSFTRSKTQASMPNVHNLRNQMANIIIEGPDHSPIRVSISNGASITCKVNTPPPVKVFNEEMSELNKEENNSHIQPFHINNSQSKMHTTNQNSQQKPPINGGQSLQYSQSNRKLALQSSSNYNGIANQPFKGFEMEQKNLQSSQMGLNSSQSQYLMNNSSNQQDILRQRRQQQYQLNQYQQNPLTIEQVEFANNGSNNIQGLKQQQFSIGQNDISPSFANGTQQPLNAVDNNLQLMQKQQAIQMKQPPNQLTAVQQSQIQLTPQKNRPPLVTNNQTPPPQPKYQPFSPILQQRQIVYSQRNSIPFQANNNSSNPQITYSQSQQYPQNQQILFPISSTAFSNEQPKMQIYSGQQLNQSQTPQQSAFLAQNQQFIPQQWQQQQQQQPYQQQLQQLDSSRRSFRSISVNPESMQLQQNLVKFQNPNQNSIQNSNSTIPPLNLNNVQPPQPTLQSQEETNPNQHLDNNSSQRKSIIKPQPLQNQVISSSHASNSQQPQNKKVYSVFQPNHQSNQSNQITQIKDQAIKAQLSNRSVSIDPILGQQPQLVYITPRVIEQPQQILQNITPLNSSQQVQSVFYLPQQIQQNQMAEASNQPSFAKSDANGISIGVNGQNFVTYTTATKLPSTQSIQNQTINDNPQPIQHVQRKNVVQTTPLASTTLNRPTMSYNQNSQLFNFQEVTPDKRRNEYLGSDHKGNRSILQSSIKKQVIDENEIQNISEKKLAQYKELSKSPSRFFAHVKDQLHKIKKASKHIKNPLSSYNEQQSLSQIEQSTSKFQLQRYLQEDKDMPNLSSMLNEDVHFNEENQEQNMKELSESKRNINQQLQQTHAPKRIESSSYQQLARSKQQIQNIKERIAELSKKSAAEEAYNQFQLNAYEEQNDLNHSDNREVAAQEQIEYQHSYQKPRNKKNQFQLLINAAEYSLELDTDYSPIVDGKKVNLNIFKNVSRLQDSTESLQAQLKINQ